MFRKAKIQNSNVWKSQNLESQCVEKPNFRFPMIGQAIV